MQAWERVKRDIQKAMKEGATLLKESTAGLTTEARRLAKEGTSSMTEEGRRLARIGKLRYEAYRLAQQGHAKFAQIGEVIYAQASRNAKEIKLNQKVQKLIAEAKEIDTQTKKLEADIRKLSKKK